MVKDWLTSLCLPHHHNFFWKGSLLGTPFCDKLWQFFCTNLKVHKKLDAKKISMKFLHCVLMYEFIIDVIPIPSFAHTNWNYLQLKNWNLLKWTPKHPKCSALLCFHLVIFVVKLRDSKVPIFSMCFNW